VNLLRSELLAAAGFVHAFSTRRGGVSGGCFASLNLGRGLGDVDAAVAENHARLATAVGYEPGSLYEVEQVHGVRCVVATNDSTPNVIEADAVVALRGHPYVAIRTADCVPLLLADARRGCVAAVHAGWRGAVAGVLAQAVEALLSARPEIALEAGEAGDLLVAVGPHIRREAFEVGEEVAERVEAAAPGRSLVTRHGTRPHADLTGLVRAQLEGLGVGPGAIDDVGGCTYTDAERFFSHRRDRGHSGRHLAVIGPRPG